MRMSRPSLLLSRWPLLVSAASLTLVLALSACSTPSTPEGVEVVSGFDADRYAGHWFEVARIDNPRERSLTQASADYSRNPDDTLKVVNRGYDPVRKVWKQAQGTAHFVGETDRAALKLSFFGPFYGGYHVVALDENYQWAMVIGSNKDYLWILSRTPTLPWHVREHLVERADALGVDVRKIVFVQPAGEQHAQGSLRN